MSERFDRDEFRTWLASFEADDKPFGKTHHLRMTQLPVTDCPLMAWQRELGLPCIVSETFWTNQGDSMTLRPLPSWAVRFISAVDKREAPKGPWQDLTAKDALTVLDGIDLA